MSSSSSRVFRRLVLLFCVYRFLEYCLFFRIFFSWPLHFLCFFGLRLLITHLVSSNLWFKIISTDYIPIFSVSETPCSSMPCLNNGTCAVNGSTFTCSCSDGYYGEVSAPFLCVSFFGILFVLSSFFLLTLAFSVLLRFTAFDYPFGIFKLVLCPPTCLIYLEKAYVWIIKILIAKYFISSGNRRVNIVTNQVIIHEWG
jgi:hypothetical protein